jgi:hypothetical protein
VTSIFVVFSLFNEKLIFLFFMSLFPQTILLTKDTAVFHLGQVFMTKCSRKLVALKTLLGKIKTFYLMEIFSTLIIWRFLLNLTEFLKQQFVVDVRTVCCFLFEWSNYFYYTIWCRYNVRINWEIQFMKWKKSLNYTLG